MMLLYALLSILGITALAFLFTKVTKFHFCPVCAGVCLTWIWMLAAIFFGMAINPILPAILMGGSIVGIAYQLEKHLSPHHSPLASLIYSGARRPALAGTPTRSRRALAWKTIFLPLGFGVMYFLVLFQWPQFFAALFLIFLAVIFFFAPRKHHVESALEKKMDDCC